MTKLQGIVVQDRTNALTILYHLAFVLLAVSAIFFYEERLYGDSGAYIFDVINNRTFCVMNSRFILAVSQWLAVLAVWMHLPLKIVLIAYSLGHVLFFYLLFLIGHYWLKKPYSGPLFILAQLLGVNFTYFAWPFGEVPYGMGVVLLIIMMLISLTRINWWQWMLIGLLTFLVVTSHPFVIILLGFGLALLFFRKEYRRPTLIGGLIVIATLAVKFIAFPDYMGDLIGQRVNEGLSLNFSWKEFKGMLWNHALLFASLGLLAMVQLIHKRFFWFVLVIPSSLLIMFIIKQYFPLNGATQQYYVSFSGLFLITLVIDIFDRTPNTGTLRILNRYTPPALLGLALLSYFPILRIAPEFTDRTKKIKHLIAECRELEGNRCIINGYNYFKTTENIWMESEIRIESILLGCQSNQPAYLF